MPRGDRSGPAGMGPGTGRAAGYCAGYPVAGYENPMPGRGAYGRGGGRGGRGHRNWYYATGLTGWQRASQDWYPAQSGNASYRYPAPHSQMVPQEEAKMIRGQIELLEKNIKTARERLGELETNQG
jgi:hypothetical protein